MQRALIPYDLCDKKICMYRSHSAQQSASESFPGLISILKFPREAYRALRPLRPLGLRGYLGPRKHRTCRKTTALRAKPLPCAQNHCPERSKELLEPPLGAPGRSKWLLEPWLSAPRRSKWVFEPPLGIPRALKVVV